MSKDSYRKTAKRYDMLVEPLVSHLRAIGMRMAAPQEGMLVLDIGCGTGFLFDQFTQSVKFFIGIELSINAIREAKKRLKNASNIELIRADADYTPFPNKIFDKVIAISVLQNLPNSLKTIREMKRIGKLETVFAITGLKKKFTPESFVDILERAHLKLLMLNTNQRLKGHIAVCGNVEA